MKTFITLLVTAVAAVTLMVMNGSGSSTPATAVVQHIADPAPAVHGITAVEPTPTTMPAPTTSIVAPMQPAPVHTGPIVHRQAPNPPHTSTTLASTTLFGFVRYEDGTAPYKGSVSLGRDGHDVASVATGPDGSYRIDGLRAGDYEVTVGASREPPHCSPSQTCVGPASVFIRTSITLGAGQSREHDFTV